MHSRNHADSECISYMGVDRKGAEFTDNKQIYSLIHSFTYRHSTLYISTD